MAEEMTKDEWLEYMQQKLFGMIDNSNDLYDVFEKQGEKDKEIVDIYTRTNQFEDINDDEIASVAMCLSNLVYATPLYDDYFYVHKKDGREMIFFTNYDELKEYRTKNNNCSFVYLKFEDLIVIGDYFNLDLITTFLTDCILNFPMDTFEKFYYIALDLNNK